MLLATKDLAGIRGTAEVRRVTALCSSVSLGGGFPNFNEVIRWCCSIGLLRSTTNRVGLTPDGAKFLRQNPDAQYELTETQRRFLAFRVIAAGGDVGCRDVLAKAEPDFRRGRFILRSGRARSESVGTLRALGVLETVDGEMFVAQPFTELVRGIRGQRKMTVVELNARLKERDEVGTAAEAYVVAEEQRRLTQLGLAPEATLVRRISHLDVGAGYDIESFDGAPGTMEYDRFIEVKGSTGTSLEFFWTRNEMRAARARGKQYWLYFVRGWDLKKGTATELLRLQNPVAFFTAREALVEMEAVVTQVKLPRPERLGWDASTGVWEETA